MGVRIRVNGDDHELDTDPSAPLLWVLRDDLSASSPKYGCGLEQCGACRVLVDDVPAFSCTLPVGDLEGREVTTLEGMRDDPDATAVFDALIAHNAGQCGYCLPGIAVTLVHLRKAGVVDREAIVRALDAHLCRCGSQPRILRAAWEALGSG